MRPAPAPIFGWYELLAWIEAQRTDGHSIALAIGSFVALDSQDLDHLAEAAGRCDRCVALVNPPAFGWCVRRRRLAELRMVDAVAGLDEPLHDALAAILPEVAITGRLPPHTLRDIQAIVASYGGVVETFPNRQMWEDVPLVRAA